LQRKGDSYFLNRYLIHDAPVFEKGYTPEVLAEHLKQITAQIEPKTKHVTLAVGVADSLLRNTELPQIPISEMRMMLKFNTKGYLQQELPDYVFDCYILPPKASAKPEAQKSSGKFKVWVGGTKSQYLNYLQNATRLAGLIPDIINLGILGPVNAFEAAQPEVFKKQVVALVDIGFKNSTISILSEGDLALSRVVGIGGDKLTAGIAEALGVSYAEAEGIKVGMPQEVESSLIPLLSPLGRELRASIDFFEHQEDKAVSHVYISGSAARSDYIVQALQAEMLVTCSNWNPTSFLGLSLPPQYMAEIEQIAPQLAVAVGAAAGSI